MRTTFFFLLFSFCMAGAIAQPSHPSSYLVDNIALPESMNNQVCISGIKSLNNKLYFASERCPVIYEFDPESKTISNKIDLQVPQNFEMEGLTAYKGKLYLISENIAAVYEVNIKTNELKQVSTSIPLPPKSKQGDGTEGIAANEKNNKFYILRERNEKMTNSQIYTYSIQPGQGDSPISLNYESTIELPLDNAQWRYSDITVDNENGKLICLKSYSKGKTRQQFLESLDIDSNGNLSAASLKNIPVENFTETSALYKDEDFSMNLEGVTLDTAGNFYIISDNTSGRAMCAEVALEKTILLKLKHK